MPALPWLLLALLCPCGTLACPWGCHCQGEDGVVRCTHGQLRQIPPGLPHDTRVLHLDANELTQLLGGTLRHLRQLQELYLPHNLLETITPAALGELGRWLQLLDLSHNRLRQLGPAAPGPRLQATLRLQGNPWHCSCTLQELLEALPRAAETLEAMVCASAARPEYVGQPLARLLSTGVDFCHSPLRTTDVAMLLTVFGWLVVVIAYVIYYVARNQAETRRHLEYLKALPIRQLGPEDAAAAMEEDMLSTTL